MGDFKKTHLSADEIHQLFDLAVKINTTYMENEDRPMAFIRYFPHVQRIDVDIHYHGFTIRESTRYPDVSYVIYICGQLYDYKEYTECKLHLEKMLKRVSRQRLMESIAEKQAEEKDYDIPESEDSEEV